jgi:S1-C subfamily serine protease
MRRALAATAALAAFAAGCGGGGGTKTVTQASETQTQTTKVEVLRGSSSAGRSGFDPGTIYKTEGPGVVTLVALSGSGRNLQGRASEALGSGFVVDGEGYIATNAHVVTSDSGKRAAELYVQFADGNELPGRIVGTDPDSDVALVKVDPAQLRGPGAKLVPLPFGSTSELQVGDPVAAIGSPFGEQQSLSVGVVSALNRDIESLTNFSIGNAIQTDAAINHGNSGGPLLDGSGKVIGINAQIQSTGGGGEGVGFAIPIETVKRSVEQLRAQGHVDYAYLGVSTVSLYPQLAQRLGIKVLEGGLIDHVQASGPAAAAGLHGADSHITFQGVHNVPVGSDVILAVGSRRLSQAQDLSDLIGVHRPGDTVKLTILRDNKKRTVSVKLGKRPGRGD